MKRILVPAVLAVVIVLAGGTIICVQAARNSKSSDAKTVYKETTVMQGNITAGVTESGSTALGTDTFDYDIGSVSVSSTGGSSSSSSTAGSSSSSGSSQSGNQMSLGTSGSSGGNSSGNSTSSSSSSGSSGVSTQLEVEKIYVSESSSVSNGAAILKVTDASREKVKQELTAAVATAQLSLKKAEIERSLTQVDADNTYSSNKLKKTTAQEAYDNTVTKLQNAVDQAKEEMDETAAEIEEYEYYIDNYSDTAKAPSGLTTSSSSASGTVSSQQSTGAASKSTGTASTQTSSADNLTLAKEKLATLRNTYTNLELTYQEKLVSQKEGLLSAKETLDEALVTASNADALYEIATNGIDDDVDEATESLANANEVLAAFQKFVGDGTIYADFDGMVTEVSVEEGSKISSGTTILTHANADEVTIEVSVDQEDVAQIALNDSVNIDFTAYSGRMYQGIVTGISTSTASEKSSTVSYSVTVTVSGDVSKLYSGMTADVTFVTKELQNVLYVSNKAVSTQGTKSYVTIKDAAAAYIRKEVTTGFSNGNNVEIKSGLSAGDTVYIERQVNSN